MLPAARLLYAKRAPLLVTEGAVLGDLLGSLFRKDNVPVLELAVLVLFGVVDLCHIQGKGT